MSQRINYDFKKIKTKLSLKIKIHSLHTNIVASIRMNKNYKKKKYENKKKTVINTYNLFSKSTAIVGGKEIQTESKKKTINKIAKKVKNLNTIRVQQQYIHTYIYIQIQTNKQHETVIVVVFFIFFFPILLQYLVF